MEQAKMLFQRLLHPSRWVLLFVPPLSFVALIFIFAAQNTRGALAYPIYCMSAYSLAIWLAAIPRLTKRIKSAIMSNRIVQKAAASKITGRYLNDLAFRGSISIYQGMAVNFFYTVFRIAAGIRYTSVWFISMAVYYLVLGCLRVYLIICYRRRNPELERRCYHTTAWLLFLLNIPMGGMIVLMVRTNSGFAYPGSIIYLSALYTFYAMTVSVINLAKFRRLGSPILSAAKVLNFIAAMMSILGLQTAMIARFSENGENYRKMMNAITGGFIYGTVILIAIVMLLKHERRWKRLNKSESKYFATAARMDEAFLALLEKKDFAYITVKEICQTAGVNRSTFYLHYETMADLLSESVSHMNEQFLAHMKKDSQTFVAKLRDCPLDELYLITPEYLTPYLGYIEQHKRLFRTATENAAVLGLDKSYDRMFHHVITPILDRYGVPEQDRPYLMSFYLHGLMAIISEWLRNSCADPIAYVVDTIQRCVKHRGEEP